MEKRVDSCPVHSVGHHFPGFLSLYRFCKVFSSTILSNKEPSFETVGRRWAGFPGCVWHSFRSLRPISQCPRGLLSQHQLSAAYRTRWSAGAGLSTWVPDTHTSHLTLIPSLAQSWLWQAMGEWTSTWKLPVSCHSASPSINQSAKNPVKRCDN